MADAPASGTSTPQDEGTPNPGSEQASEANTPAPAPSSYPRRRRLGRPPKNRPPDWGLVDESEQGHEGTPFKRRRGRPPTGGGRWGKARGGPSHSTQVPIDKEGNMMDVIDDEVALPEDAEGETKVDKLGHLQDGRDYRCRTFTILGRGERLYMLSTEPARCIGFRDSYLFFQKHKQLYKIIIDEREKKDLIDRDLIPHSYKGRAIGVVTARSVFREFGARIIIAGKKVVDDYQVQAARTNGDVEGELADPSDRLPKPGEEYNKNQYVAWHGASAVYHSGAPSVPMPNGKPVEGGKKRKVVVTDVNWMFEHAREASRFNGFLTAARRDTLDGVYDPHTNIMQLPQIMQPTHARWEPISSQQPPAPPASTTAGITHTSNDPSSDPSDPSTSTIFPALAPIYTRNLLITDTYYHTPPISGLGNPGTSSAPLDDAPAGKDDQFNDSQEEGEGDGDTSLGSLSEDVLSELPPDCLKALRKAQEAERAWTKGWRSEGVDGGRGNLRIGF
ncbi:MAG: hypothetical protein M4579_000638 [Chaenotheca gracillima]|nr:MAG: hypothetical protein M4579_000638 [Chaenotheca gracillima]